jgi:hypothetical protein
MDHETFELEQELERGANADIVIDDDDERRS